jgi:hypothetical protein
VLARQSASKSAAKVRKAWLEPVAVSWPRLSTPREILSDWLADAGIVLENPEAVPHDLWDDKQLPALPLVERVVLLLSGFDKTCRISASGKSCRIVPIGEPVLVTLEYESGKRLRELVAEFKEIPGVSLNRRGSHLAVTARWEDHQRIREFLDGGSRPAAEASQTAKTNQTQQKQNSQQVFSLRLANQPVGKVIDQLAGQLGLTVTWNPELLKRATDPRTTLVSCDVTNGDLPSLLGAILSPAQLQFELQDKQLKILPAQ